MKLPLLLAALTLGTLALPTTASAQHYHRSHGRATTRHCQTDYDHRPHTYHSGTHYHYCPGGAHYHGGHVHGGVRRVSNYDPVVADIQRALQNGGHYAHAHRQVDGIFGPETAGAIRSFQQAKGLEVTGMIDAGLLAALGIGAPAYGGAIQVAATTTTTTGGPDPIAAGPQGDILTPQEAARVMRVSEADVIELLEAGDLTGKKIGSSWRISRAAIDEFMQSKN